ncbi:TPA: KilA-N domain-containing protein [Escherichia coli]|nr:KilA-N domain-containing protein [Escherichia coli]HAW2942339.1 KilA-N domain-containing protein [Escherichia coli]
MKHEVVLPVIVDGYHWACNQDRMWNLNELHKELELPSAKEPSEWNNKIRTQLDRSGNFRTVNGDGGGTWATEAGAVAYAMWVSPDAERLQAKADQEQRFRSFAEALAGGASYDF